MRRSSCFLAVIGLLILGGPGISLAQEAAAPSEATAETSAVPVEEVAIRADDDERFARGVSGRAVATDMQALFEPRLAALDLATRQLARDTEGFHLRTWQAFRLDSLARHWSFYGRQLAAWRADLQRSSSRLAADAADLGQRRLAWEATRAVTREQGVEAGLDERISTVLGQISAASEALARPLDQDARLVRRAARIESRIEAEQSTVDKALDAWDERLWTVDARPLWSPDGAAAPSDEEVRGSVEGFLLEIRFLGAYVDANERRLALHAAGIALLLPVLLWVRRRSEALLAGDESLRSSARILLRPLSSWLLLAFISIPILTPDAPLLLHEAAFMLALIPVLRILPARVFSVLGRWPYVLTALYVLLHLGMLFVTHPLHERAFLLVATLFTLGSLVLLLRARREASFSGPVRAFLRAAGWTAVAGLAVSAIANVLGNVTLAAVIMAGVIDAAYIGLVLFAGVGVLEALLGLATTRSRRRSVSLLNAHAESMLRGVLRLAAGAAILLWISSTLAEFRLLRPVWSVIQSMLGHSIEIGEVSLTPGNVVLFFLAAWLATWIARTVRLVLEGKVLPRMDLPRGVDSSVASLSYYALVLLGLIFALAAAGFEVSQLAIVFGALGVGIGFGLQNIVNNFVSGIILMFERPIRPGDTVEVSGTAGTVRVIGIRATTVTTFEGAEVVVPNGALLSEKLINWTLSTVQRRIDVPVGVAYGSEPARVISLLREVAAATPGVAAQPPAIAQFMGFGASSLDFVVRAWTDDSPNWGAIRSDLVVRIHDALAAADIEIPFPQQDVHVRSVAAQAALSVAPAGEAPKTPSPGPESGKPD